MKKLLYILTLFISASAFGQTTPVYPMNYGTVQVGTPSGSGVGNLTVKGRASFLAGKVKQPLDFVYWAKADSLYQPILGFTPANDANIWHKSDTTSILLTQSKASNTYQPKLGYAAANDALVLHKTDTSTYLLTKNQAFKKYKQIGTTIYDNAYFANYNDFTAVGFTPTIVNNSIEITGGAGATNYSQYLQLKNAVSSDENVQYEVKFKVVATGAGIGIGGLGNQANCYSSYFEVFLNTSTNTLTILTIPKGCIGGGTMKTFTLPYTISAGDYIRLRYTQFENDVNATIEDLSKSIPTYNSIQFSIPLQNTAIVSVSSIRSPTLFNHGGTYDVEEFKVTSATIREANIVVISNSKGNNMAQYSPLRISNLLAQLGTVQNMSANSAQTADFLAEVPYIISLAPKNVIIIDPYRNDISSSISSTIWQANISAFYSQLTAAGIKVIFLIGTDETVINQTSGYNFITSNFPTGNIINVLPGWVIGTMVGPDNVHLTVEGMRYVASQIVASGLFPLDSRNDINIRDYLPRNDIDQDHVVGLTVALASKGPGTITSFSKTDNYGIISTVTNPTTTPNHGVGVDSSVIAPKAYVNNFATKAFNVATYVPKTTTVAGFALSSNISLANHSVAYALLGTTYNGSAVVNDWRVDTTVVKSKSGALIDYNLLKANIATKANLSDTSLYFRHAGGRILGNVAILNTTPILTFTETTNNYSSVLSKSPTLDNLKLTHQVYQAGGQGSAIILNGTTQRGTFSDITQINSSTTLTFQQWIKPGAVANDGSTIFIGSATVNSQVRISFPVGGGIRVTYGGSTSVIGTTVFNPGLWYNIAITINGNVSIAYVNGTNIGTKTVTWTGPSQNSTNNIGAFNTGSLSNFFNGEIDQTLIYNRVLSSTEIVNNYNGGYGTPSPNTTTIVARWEFDEGTGTTAADISGNAYNITFINTPTWDLSGKVSKTGAIQTGTAFSFQDGINNSELGQWMYGDPQGSFIGQGKAIRFNINNTFPFLQGIDGHIVIDPTITNSLPDVNGSYNAGSLLKLGSGTSTVSPLNIPGGTLKSTPVNGDIENDGTYSYITNSGGVRNQIALSGINDDGLIASLTGISGTATSNTTLVTVPTGKTLIITKCMIVCDAASGVTTGPTVNVSNLTASDVYGSTAINALTTAGLDFGFATVGMSRVALAGTTVTFNLTAGSTGTSPSQILSIYLFGKYK